VTGGAGFIGSHLCERLLSEGREVVTVDDFSHGSRANLASFVDHPSFEFHELDCRDVSALRRAFDGCDAVVHLAAEKIPRYGGALHTLEANVATTRAACDVALALDALAIVTSTSDVYGNATPPLAEDAHLVIGPSTTRRWSYAVSKLYDEHIALALAHEQGLRTVILRLFNVYGPRNHPSWWGGPITAFTETLLDGEVMDLHGDGRQVRTFTYVTDTVDGFVRALDTPAAEGEILNIGGDEPITIMRLAAAIQEALGIPGPLRANLLPYEKIGGKYQDVRCRIPDIEKAARLLGFQATVGLEDGLRESIAYHRALRATPALTVEASGAA
jgi:UDP-glucose 4-epimerase